MSEDAVAVLLLAVCWSVIAGILCTWAIVLKRAAVRRVRFWRVRQEFRSRLYRDMQQAGYGDHKPLWK